MEDKAEEKRTEKETKFSQQVYDTLIDELTEESKIAGVENAYQEGSDCGQLYDEVLKTGWALSKNMGIENGDMHPDIQLMIDQLGKIQKILCLKMFHNGRLFAGKEFPGKKNLPGLRNSPARHIIRVHSKRTEED